MQQLRTYSKHEYGGPKAAIKESAKTACTDYRLARLTLFMNQVQINQCLVAAHRYIGIVFYQAGKRTSRTRYDV